MCIIRSSRRKLFSLLPEFINRVRKIMFLKTDSAWTLGRAVSAMCQTIPSLPFQASSTDFQKLPSVAILTDSAISLWCFQVFSSNLVKLRRYILPQNPFVVSDKSSDDFSQSVKGLLVLSDLLYWNNSTVVLTLSLSWSCFCLMLYARCFGLKLDGKSSQGLKPESTN